MSRQHLSPEAAAAIDTAIEHLLRAEAAVHAASRAAREDGWSNGASAVESLAAQIERAARAAETVADAYPPKDR